MTISIASRTQPKKREKRQKRCRVPWNKGIKFLLCLTGVREKGREIVFLPRRIYRGGIVLGKNETRFLLNYAPADSVSRVSDRSRSYCGQPVGSDAKKTQPRCAVCCSALLYVASEFANCGRTSIATLRSGLR